MTPLEFVIQQVINAVSIGSLYALMAIGLAMVFGILRLINFAHGDIIMVGSYTTLLVMVYGLPFWVAAIAGVVAATGVAFDYFGVDAIAEAREHPMARGPLECCGDFLHGSGEIGRHGHLHLLGAGGRREQQDDE